MRYELEGEWVCGVGFDVTVYFSRRPSLRDASAAAGAYVAICPRDRIAAIKSEDVGLWEEIGDSSRSSLLERHLAGFGKQGRNILQVWDDRDDEDSWSLSIGRVTTIEDEPAASFCQALVPVVAEPEVLLQLARDWAETLPNMLSGHGGYCASFNPWSKEEAFDRIHAWAKRFIGMDVQDLNRTLPSVLHGVKGAGWITLLGEEMWTKLCQAVGRVPMFPPSVTVYEHRFARVIVAGECPSLGDRNRLEFPHSQASVEKALSPIKVTDHAPFWGPFAEDDTTSRWLHRLERPAEW